VVVVACRAQLLACDLAPFAGLSGGLGGEEGVAGCEMASADVAEGRDPLARVRLGERPLRRVL
jgi:hypothetical protein